MIEWTAQVERVDRRALRSNNDAGARIGTWHTERGTFGLELMMSSICGREHVR